MQEQQCQQEQQRRYNAAAAVSAGAAETLQGIKSRTSDKQKNRKIEEKGCTL